MLASGDPTLIRAEIARHEQNDRMRIYKWLELRKITGPSIIDEIYKKDIQKNNRIKNRKLFDTIRTYFINNFGSLMSVGRLCDYLERTTKETVRKETVYRYISILENVIYNYARSFGYEISVGRIGKNRSRFYPEGYEYGL